MITKVRAVGFRNISNKSMTFSRGVNLIRGRNGQGKTSLIEAIPFCLYGTNLKGENKDSVIMKKPYRGSDWKGTACLVWYQDGEDEYTFIRSIKHRDFKTGLYVLKNGVDEGYSSVKDAQAAIDSILQVSASTFTYSILFGQRMQRLMEAGESDKRDVFEELFESNFNYERELAKQKRDEVAVDLKEVEARVMELERMYDNDTDRIKDLQQFVSDFNERKKEKIKLLQGKMKGLKKPAKVEDPGEFDKKVENYIDLAVTPPAPVAEPVLEDVEEVCNSCGRKHTKKTIEVERKALQERYDKKKTAYDKYLKEAEKYASEKIKVHSKNEEIKKHNESIECERAEWQKEKDAFVRYKNDLKNYEGEVNRIKADIEEAKNTDAQSWKKMLKKRRAKLIEIEEELKALRVVAGKKKHKYDGYNFWYTKGFSKDGLPAYVFDANLLAAEQAVSKYAEKFDYQIEIKTNLDGKRKNFEINVTKPDGVRFNYSSLSGGEKCRVDLALAFGVNEFISRNKNFGVMFFDEFLDGFDEESLYMAFEILKGVAIDKSVNIISHTRQFDGFGANEINF